MNFGIIYTTHQINAGAELVDIKTLLGHENVATTQIYTNAGQERMEKVGGDYEISCRFTACRG